MALRRSFVFAAFLLVACGSESLKNERDWDGSPQTGDDSLDGRARTDAPSADRSTYDHTLGDNDASKSDVNASGDSSLDTILEPSDADGSTDVHVDVDVARVEGGTNCNDYAQSAPEIHDTCVATSIPDPAGGVPSDGVYLEVVFDQYSGSNGPSGSCGMPHRFMAVLKGSQLDIVASDSATGLDQRYKVDVAFVRNTAMWTFVCPANRKPLLLGYSATPTDLTFYNSTNPAAPVSFTLRRQ